VSPWICCIASDRWSTTLGAVPSWHGIVFLLVADRVIDFLGHGSGSLSDISRVVALAYPQQNLATTFDPGQGDPDGARETICPSLQVVGELEHVSTTGTDNTGDLRVGSSGACRRSVRRLFVRVADAPGGLILTTTGDTIGSIPSS